MNIEQNWQAKRPLGMALATQKSHKAEGYFREPGLGSHKRGWLKVPDVVEPIGTDNRTLGIGKKEAQKIPLTEARVFESLVDTHTWAWSSLDVTIRALGMQLNKPEGDPWLHMTSFFESVSGALNLVVSNILTTELIQYDDPTWVGWRDLEITLPESYVKWLASGEGILKAEDKGWIEPGMVIPDSNLGLRFDRLFELWGEIGREVSGARREELVVKTSKEVIKVDDKESGREASKLAYPYLRGVAPGLAAGAIGVVERYRRSTISDIL